MARILIVDDDQDAGESIAKVLQNSGYEAVYMHNGRDALASILQQLPDVVLLDLAMPEMDGPSFLEVVRSYLRIQSLPVVVLTGMAESPMVDRMLALKVNTVLVKGRATSEDIQKALEEAIVRVPG